MCHYSKNDDTFKWDVGGNVCLCYDDDMLIQDTFNKTFGIGNELRRYYYMTASMIVIRRISF